MFVKKAVKPLKKRFRNAGFEIYDNLFFLTIMKQFKDSRPPEYHFHFNTCVLRVLKA